MCAIMYVCTEPHIPNIYTRCFVTTPPHTDEKGVYSKVGSTYHACLLHHPRINLRLLPLRFDLYITRIPPSSSALAGVGAEVTVVNITKNAKTHSNGELGNTNKIRERAPVVLMACSCRAAPRGHYINTFKNKGTQSGGEPTNVPCPTPGQARHPR